MEEIMRRTLSALTVMLLLAASAAAQEVQYALPQTSFTLEVEATQEHFFAGPYAAFAKRLLNLDVRSADEVSSQISQVRILPRTEADPSAWYSCDAENATLLSLSSQGLVCFAEKAEAAQNTWRFPAPAQDSFGEALTSGPQKSVVQIEYRKMATDTGSVNVPVEQRVLVNKTLEEKAAEAASLILKLRQDRLDIVTGNTDAVYYGNSMEVALKEIDRLENEYRALFEGQTVVHSFSGSFEVIPNAGEHRQRYLVFRLREEGFTTDGTKGIPFYLELTPESEKKGDDASAQKKAKGNPIRYRIPAICRVSFTQDGHPLMSTRVPVYQLGQEGQLPNAK